MSVETAADTSAPPSEAFHAPPPPARRFSRRRRSGSVAAMVVQVVLIAVGVFLGLAGEEWREDRENRRLATETIRRFRTEVATNRDAVLGVKDYHAEKRTQLTAYLTATAEERVNLRVQLDGIRILRFESTAWDLALATGTLAYLDAELAFALSRVYAAQAMLDGLTNGLSQAMYLRPLTLDLDGFLAAVNLYYDDLTYTEPGLVADYEALLLALDEALAE
jgi:hypothetical protein